MSMSHMFGYGHVGADAAAANQSAARASSQAGATRRDVYYLEDRLERLSLVCMAMWSLIQDKTDLTEEDLLQRVKMIDLMDGEADGKASRTATECPNCRRVMSARHQRCIYCGSERRASSAFDAI
ncbi:MAG: hypothetical protein ACLFV3_09390 [Phycisphaeraceae bacterium]